MWLVLSLATVISTVWAVVPPEEWVRESSLFVEIRSYTGGPPLKVLDVSAKGRRLCANLMASADPKNENPKFAKFAGFAAGSRGDDTPERRANDIETLHQFISSAVADDGIDCVVKSYMLATDQIPASNQTVSNVTTEVFRRPFCPNMCTRLKSECPRLNVVLKALKLDVPCPKFDFGDYGFGHSWAIPPVYNERLPFASMLVADRPTYFVDNAEQRHDASCFDIWDTLAKMEGPVALQCESPKVPTENGEACAMQCPAPRGYSERTQNALDGLLSSAGIIGLVISLVVCVTWASYKPRQQFPSRIAAYFAVSLLIFSISLLIPNDECAAGSATEANESSQCAFTGFLFVFGSIGMSAWWACFCFALFYMVVLGIRKNATSQNLASFEPFMHAASWALAGLCAVVPLIAGQYRYNPGSPLCFLSSAQSSNWIIVCFLVPHCTLLGIGLVLQAILLVDTCKAALSIKRYDSLRTLTKFALFVPLYLITLTSLCVFFIQLSISLNEFSDAVDDLVVCMGEDYPHRDIVLAVTLTGSYGPCDEIESGMSLEKCLSTMRTIAYENCMEKTYSHLFPPTLDAAMRIGLLLVPLAFFAGIFWCSLETAAAFLHFISCGRWGESHLQTQTRTYTDKSRTQTRTKSTRAAGESHSVQLTKTDVEHDVSTGSDMPQESGA
ncbi:MAG: hypothetical protein MHM6MM_001707 [Cercozoa sp. M6MM]